MYELKKPETTCTCIGTIVSIDEPNRTMVVHTANGLRLELGASPGCRVVLNGEEVRLRLLVPGDAVNAFFVTNGDALKATLIRVLTSGKFARS